MADRLDDEEWDDLAQVIQDCGQTDEGRSPWAGTEHCDVSCPFRNTIMGDERRVMEQAWPCQPSTCCHGQKGEKG